ncbi:TPA: tetratricopeptide repeat protein [Photobacterium damselae]
MRKNLYPQTIIPQELYVSRSADNQVKELIENMGRPGYILVSRQMGKTNLLINAKRNLQSNSDIITYIDLSNKFDSARDCFRNIIDRIIDTNYDLFCDIESEISNRREKVKISEHKEHSYELRKILNVISGKLVISLDEIDSLTQADYSDKIFSQIRSVYFDRVNFNEFNRLTYILSGVAEPGDIIKDNSISPFNIGQKILLGDFSFDEYSVFINKSGIKINDEVKKKIFEWANGNPRLTWDICANVEERLIEGKTVSIEDIDDIVNIQYLNNYDKPPVDHIRTLVSKDNKLRDGVIALKYGKASSLSDDIKSKLYLSGILDSNYEEGEIKIKNKIIDFALDDAWLESLGQSDSLSIGTADSFFSNEEYLKAIKQYETLLKNSDNLTYNEEQVIYYKLAASYHTIKNYSKVVEFCDSYNVSIEHNKVVYLEMLWFKGSAYHDMKLYSEAIDCYKQLIEIDSEDRSSIYYRSSIDYVTILLEEPSCLKNSKASIEELLNQLVTELSDEYTRLDSKLKSNEVSDLLSLVYFTLGNYHVSELDSENAITAFLSSLENAIDEMKFFPLYELMKLESSNESGSNNKFEYFDAIYDLIKSSQREIPLKSSQFILNGDLVKNIIVTSSKLYESEKLLSLINVFRDNISISDEGSNFYSIIIHSALSFVKIAENANANFFFEYVFSQKRKDVEPKDYYYAAKLITQFDQSNDDAKVFYFERFLNYTEEAPDNIDFKIFETEIIALRNENKYQKAVALCDVFLSSDRINKNEFSSMMIPIIFLKMLCHDCDEERLNIAHSLKTRLASLQKSEYEQYRLTASTVRHFLLNSKQIIAEFSPIEQVHYTQKRYKRNEKVKVRLSDGSESIKKYKQVEELIKQGECEII